MLAPGADAWLAILSPVDEARIGSTWRARKNALILPGGGFRGAYQVGFIKALQAKDLRFDLVAGVSVGALNGALLAQGDIALLENLWDEIDKLGPRAIFNYWPFWKLPFKRSLCSTDPLKRLLTSYIDQEKIRASSTQLFLAATSLRTGQWKWFTNDSPDLVDGLVASCALPPFFEPVRIGDEFYVDGGVRSNVPMQPAYEQKCDQIIIACTNKEMAGETESPMTRKQALGLGFRLASCLLSPRAFHVAWQSLKIFFATRDQYVIEMVLNRAQEVIRHNPSPPPVA